MSDIRHWLKQTTTALAAVSATPDIEAKLCCCHVLQVNNSYLYSYADRMLTGTELAALAGIVQRRLTGEPLAYILGSWVFWGLELAVEPCTLIPRADTECLVERVLALSLPVQAKVLDLGTGTGAIALALASSRPQWQLTAVDFQPQAVALAQRNVATLGIHNCTVLHSDWYQSLQGQQFDLIVSNPPYIEEHDPHLNALTFEPVTALTSLQQGLADIRHICQLAPHYLNNNGWLWLEHGYNQAEAVQQILLSAGFKQVQSERDYGGNWRMSGGCLTL